jgi:hypothetical protein
MASQPRTKLIEEGRAEVVITPTGDETLDNLARTEMVNSLDDEVVVTTERKVQIAGYSQTVQVVPWPGALCTSIVPPWASIRARAMARPSPEPPLARSRAASAR